MAIVRRTAYGKKIFVADWKLENTEAITKTLAELGLDAVPFKVDISDRKSALEFIVTQKKDEIAIFMNAAGLFPSQSTKEPIL